LIKQLLSLSRINKQVAMLFIGAVLLVLIFRASFSIRLGYWYFPDSDLIWVVLGAPIIAIPIFVRFGLYRAVIRHIGFKALWV
jgi:FlaA1/EpsC-like NDP-sugar epimerase